MQRIGKILLYCMAVLSIMMLPCIIKHGTVALAADIRNLVQYEVREDGVYITDLKQDVETLTVPYKIDGKPVVSIYIGMDWKIEKKLE